MRRRAALAAVVVSAACFGTLAVLAQLAYRAWPGGADASHPLTLLAWRFLIAAAVMAAYLVVRDPRSLLVGRDDLVRYAALALTGYGAASICFFFALRHAPAAVVSILLYTYPVLVALASRALGGERFTPLRSAGIAAAFAGCVLVLDPFGAGRPAPLGVVLGLGAAAGYAAFSLLSQRWVSRRPRLVLMTYTFGFAGVAVSGLAIATGSGMSPAGWGPRLWVLLAAIVAVPTFAAVVLYLQGIRSLGAAQAAVISTLEPIVTVVLAWAVLGEVLRAWQIAGVTLVLSGVLAAELGVRRARAEEPAAV